MKQLKTDILVKTMRIVNPASLAAKFNGTQKLNLRLPSLERSKSMLPSRITGLGAHTNRQGYKGIREGDNIFFIV